MVVRAYRNTELTCAEIAKEVGLSTSKVERIIRKAIPIQERKKLQAIRKSNANFGRKNAMYKGGTKIHCGYRYIQKPYWFTGKGQKGYASEHNVVLLQHLGLTELPVGTVVHHVDGDKLNNSIFNLVLMDRADHITLHNIQGD